MVNGSSRSGSEVRGSLDGPRDVPSSGKEKAGHQDIQSIEAALLRMHRTAAQMIECATRVQKLLSV